MTVGALLNQLLKYDLKAELFTLGPGNIPVECQVNTQHLSADAVLIFIILPEKPEETA